MQDDGTYGIIKSDYEYNDTSIINRFIAYKNPFRYRSYYYDFETNLYYLNSRYYDPEIGRFINADNISILSEGKDLPNGLNLYNYCGNNPINNTDGSGEAWWEWLLSAIIAIVTIAAVVAVSVFTAGLGMSIAGALGGGVGATIFGSAAGGAITGTITGALMSFGISIISQGLTVGYDDINWGQVGINTLIGAASGFVSGAIFGAISGTVKIMNAAKAWGAAYDKSGNLLRKPLANMKHHYKIHVINEHMQGTVKNIINYTNIGKNLWKNAANIAKILPSGNLKIPFSTALGSGGIYTTIGKILSIFLR